jgi:type IV pilus assembly protein PilE
MPMPIARLTIAPAPVRRRARGFTLIELMITVAIVAILAAIAMPGYSAYIRRAKVPAGLDALQAYFTRMEQRFQDNNSYAGSSASACAIAAPTVPYFNFACVLTAGNGYTATVTGHSALAGYAYTINQNGQRATTAHPQGVNATCWTIKGNSCDA